MKKETAGSLYLMLGFVLAGSASTAGKVLTSHLGPFTITALSLAFALPVLLPSLFRGKKPNLREWGMTALLGFFGIVLYRLCLISALPLIGAAHAGLMTGAAPILTALGSWTLLRERPVPHAILGVVVASAGIALVNIGTIQGNAGSVSLVGLAGTLLALGAALSESLFAILSRLAWRRPGMADARSRTALTVLWAFLFSIGPAMAEHPGQALLSIGLSGWFSLFWYGVFVTAASYVCWYEGIRIVEASRAAVFTGIVPVVSLLLPALLLGERPPATSFVGCALVALGIIATGYRPIRRTIARSPRPRR